MKTKHHLKTLLLMLCVAAANLANAATGGSIMGQVKDPDTDLPVAGIQVVLESQGSSLVFQTNESGYYYASNIPPGVYTITVRYMKNATIVENVKIGNDETQNVDLALSMISITTLTETVIDGGKSRNKLIDPFAVDVIVCTGLELSQKPVINIKEAVANSGPGILEVDGSIYVHGSRADGLAYYIDGCKITGNPNVPICGVEMMQVYTGYIPAKYGDTNAGIVAIETRNFFTE